MPGNFDGDQQGPDYDPVGTRERNRKRRKASESTRKPPASGSVDSKATLDAKLAEADRLLDEMLRHPLNVKARASRLVDARLLIHASRKEAAELREAVIKLARCAVFTLQANGKPGIGSGLVMAITDAKNGKRTVERWDKQYIEALAFVGIEVLDKPRKKGARRG